MVVTSRDAVRNLVALLLRDVQMSLAADGGFVKATQHFQRVAKVTAGFSFSDSIADCPAGAKCARVTACVNKAILD